MERTKTQKTAKTTAAPTREEFEVVVKQIVTLQNDRNFLFQVTLDQKHQIEHLQLAVLSSKAPFNARAVIDGKMVKYEHGEQVSETSLGGIRGVEGVVISERSA